MSEREITIRMPKESLDKWLAALRSGTYPQGFGLMEKNGKFCCLGVLQQVLAGEVERHACGTAVGVPSEAWLAKHRIRFLDSRPDHGNPFLPSLGMSAACANDHKHTFTQIADAIEACAEGV